MWLGVVYCVQSVDTILGESADAVTGIVRTTYGPGAIIAERGDGFVVVDLVYGRAYLRPEAILSRQQGFYAATSMFQLQRLDRLHSMLAARGLSEEERLWCDDGCLMRHLLTANWNLDKAYNALTKTLTWRFGSLDAGAVRPQDLQLSSMREVLRVFPCFVAGHGAYTVVTPAVCVQRRCGRRGLCGACAYAPPPVRLFLKLQCCGCGGCADAERRPVVVVRMDTENTLTNQQKLQGMLFAIEQALRNIYPDGPQTFTLFVDFKGFGKRHVNPTLAKDFATAYAKHYRRLLGSCIIFNSSTLFSVFWASVQPFLTKLKFSRDRLIWLRGESDEASLKRLAELLGPQTLRNALHAYPDYDQYMRSSAAASASVPRPSPGSLPSVPKSPLRPEDVVPLDQAFAYGNGGAGSDATPVPAPAFVAAPSGTFNDPFAVEKSVAVEASPVVTATPAPQSPKTAAVEAQVQNLSLGGAEGEASATPGKAEASAAVAAEGTPSAATPSTATEVGADSSESVAAEAPAPAADLADVKL